MSQEKIDACYAIVENSLALDCMKELVRDATKDKCPPKLVLLTQDNCAPCEEEEALHEEAIKEGIIQKVSVDTDEGMAIAVKNEIDIFPVLILTDCKNKMLYPTEIPPETAE